MKHKPNRKLYLIVIIIGLMIGSCGSRRNKFICGNYLLTEAEKIKSEITYFKINSSVDSEFCQVYGLVNIESKFEEKTEIEKLPYAKILFYHKIDSTWVGVITDSSGYFNTKIKEGLYDITFSFVACNKILIKNVNLKNQESFEIIAKMGRGFDTTEYDFFDYQINEVIKK